MTTYYSNSELTICDRALADDCRDPRCKHREPVKTYSMLNITGDCPYDGRSVKIIAAVTNNPNVAFKMKGQKQHEL